VGSGGRARTPPRRINVTKTYKNDANASFLLKNRNICYENGRKLNYLFYDYILHQTSKMSATANANMTNREKWAMEAEAKQGWKCYYIGRETIYSLSVHLQRMSQQVYELRNLPEHIEYDHLKHMFLELYDKVGELCDCPICYESMTKKNTHVALCGHLVCKSCKEKITDCPICRKKY
jgi:hypothetical protein